MIKHLSGWLLGITVLALSVVSCVDSGDEDIKYKQIARSWVEVKAIKDGQITQLPGRMHVFLNNMRYYRVCAVNEVNCVSASDGEWALLNDSTLQTRFNTEIHIYTIKKLSEVDFWVEDRGDRGTVIQMKSR